MIRQATDSDIESISLLTYEAWQKDLVTLLEADVSDVFTVGKFASKLKQDISDQAQIVIVYEINGKIVGYATGSTKSTNYDSEIVELYVSPKAQQGGVGSCLFNEMKSLFKAQHKSNMIVWTFLDAPNNQFYLKNNPINITHRDIIISAVKYRGIGYVYSL